MDGSKAITPALKLQKISTESCADVLSEMEINHSLDLGGALVHLGRHPDLGFVGLLSNAIGESALWFM